MADVADATRVEVFSIAGLAYRRGLALQTALCADIRAGNRTETLLFVEHTPVITLGRGWHPEHVLASEEALAARGVEVIESGRGGDVTYHGPGQLVGYPLLDLSRRGRDIHAYLRGLETVLIESLAAFGLKAEAVPGLTGVWVGGRKIAAIGVHARGWVTSHGFSLNVRDQSGGFSLIVPCGLHGKEVTSVERELGREPSMRDARLAVTAAFERVFNCEATELPASSLPLEAVR